jgi:hypothetical protein
VFKVDEPAPPDSWYNRGMPFVVKLTSRIGGVFWLGPAKKSGLRTLASRECAEVFHQYEDGNAAIRKLHRHSKAWAALSRSSLQSE